MTAVVLPVMEPLLGGAWGWLALAIVPMFMVLLRSDQRPRLRRVLAAACLACVFAVVLSADDLVVMPTCEVCKLIDPNHCWSCWFTYWANCIGC